MGDSMGHEYHGAKRREEDRSLITRFNEAMTRWRLAIWLVATLALMAGFDWKTPASQFKDINEKIDRVDHRLQVQVDTLKAQVVSGSSDRAEIRKLLESIARGQCLDRSPREASLMGLDCRKLLQGNTP
jgi:hypothetical protein